MVDARAATLPGHAMAAFNLPIQILALAAGGGWLGADIARCLSSTRSRRGKRASDGKTNG